MSTFHLNNTPSDIMHSLAERVKLVRKKQKLSQQVLAERSGVSFGSIKRFETSGQISLESLLKIAHVLKRLDDFDSLFVMTDDLSRVEKLFSDKTRRA